MNKAVRAAVALFMGFREKKPKRVKVVQVDIPEAVAVIGHVTEICYRTTHGDETVYYRHPFQEGSRPLLCSSPDGRQLLLLGGRYEFGERGIVDIDAKGRRIYEPDHGKDVGFMRRRQAD